MIKLLVLALCLPSFAAIAQDNDIPIYTLAAEMLPVMEGMAIKSNGALTKDYNMYWDQKTEESKNRVKYTNIENKKNVVAITYDDLSNRNRKPTKITYWKKGEKDKDGKKTPTVGAVVGIDTANNRISSYTKCAEDGCSTITPTLCSKLHKIIENDMEAQLNRCSDILGTIKDTFSKDLVDEVVKIEDENRKDIIDISNDNVVSKFVSKTAIAVGFDIKKTSKKLNNMKTKINDEVAPIFWLAAECKRANLFNSNALPDIKIKSDDPETVTKQ